jgi:DNA-directed RNA polymerase subunit alpha
VKAGDLTGDPLIEIVDPDSTSRRSTRRAAQAAGPGQARPRLRRADKNFDESMGIGWIPVDSAHSPVRRVNYRVESARLGRTTDYERLILEVWTNGTIAPRRRSRSRAMLLKDHLGIFIDAEESLRDDARRPGGELSGLDALLAKGIDELDLSVRSANCLKNANINTLRDLVRKSEKDMLETKNFGRKSLEELQELLSRLGLRFGMDIPERPAGAA